jgi:hypothetical protein
VHQISIRPIDDSQYATGNMQMTTMMTVVVVEIVLKVHKSYMQIWNK